MQNLYILNKVSVAQPSMGLTQRVCRSKPSSTASPAAPWWCLGWAAADRRRTQSAQGETCGREPRRSGPWWARRSFHTGCPAWSGSGASRAAGRPAPWSSHQWRASDTPGWEQRRRTWGELGGGGYEGHKQRRIKFNIAGGEWWKCWEYFSPHQWHFNVA